MPDNASEKQMTIPALHLSHILDTVKNQDFEDLIELAALTCNVPISLVTIADKDTKRFNSNYGIDDNLMDMYSSLCTYDVKQPEGILQVEDMQKDQLFREHSLVNKNNGLRFYAALPLVNEEGCIFGLIHILDYKPRRLNDVQQKALRIIGRQITGKLSVQKKIQGLQAAESSNLLLKEDEPEPEISLQKVMEQSPAAVIIFRGPGLIIETVNAPMLELLGQKENIIGQPLLQAIPELEGQLGYTLLYEVYQTKQPVYGNETPVQLKRNGKTETRYFNFTYSPLLEKGEVVGIIDMAIEITDQVNDKLALLQSEKQLREKNQEFILSNKKLVEANNYLVETEESLRQVNSELVQSKDRLQTILDIVGEGIGITDEYGNIIYTNKRNREIFKVDKESMLTLSNVSPIWNNRRLDGSPLPDGEHPVTVTIRTGNPVMNFEYLVCDQHGSSVYLRMNTTAIKDAHGKITGAIGSFADITESFLLQQQLKEKEENFRMAIAPANLGTWYIDAKTREFFPSGRLKELFGFYPDEEMPYDAAVTQIADSHRQYVIDAVEKAINEDKTYELEYPVIGYHDKQLRWLQAIGRLSRSSGENVHFSGTIADITERKLDEQRRSDFIGMVSHELRNPLTAIGGYAFILGRRAKKDDNIAVSEIVVKINRQVKRMEALINGFLEVAQLGEGKIRLNRTQFDMADLVRIAEEESLATITSHQVIFQPVEFTPVEADKDKIEQVLINMINNAVKYSPKNTDINVSCITRDSMAHVCVCDQGMGIPAKDRPYIFDRFYRVESDEMKNKKGFGIGLYICKEIIERHYGQIGVESVEGQGSSFWFSIPITVSK